LCDWATCNLRLHFIGTLLGSARRTGLLPVYGRNLYNCLCSLFFCSLLYLLHIDSKLTQTLNYFSLWTWEQLSRTLKKKFPKTQFNPPFLWFFSPSSFLLIPLLSSVLSEPMLQRDTKFLSMILRTWTNISISNWHF